MLHSSPTEISTVQSAFKDKEKEKENIHSSLCFLGSPSSAAEKKEEKEEEKIGFAFLQILQNWQRMEEALSSEATGGSSKRWQPTEQEGGRGRRRQTRRRIARSGKL